MAVWLRRAARLVPVADVSAVLAVQALVWAGAMCELISLGTWGTFDPSPTPPFRVDWCGRRYYPGPQLITRSDVDSEVAADDQPTSLRTIATAPGGRPVLAAT